MLLIIKSQFKEKKILNVYSVCGRVILYLASRMFFKIVLNNYTLL